MELPRGHQRDLKLQGISEMLLLEGSNIPDVAEFCLQELVSRMRPAECCH